MIPIKGKCFACGEAIYNVNLPCPKCGYKFTAGDNRYCPNMNFGTCGITESMCNKGVNWQTCTIKIKTDSESAF